MLWATTYVVQDERQRIAALHGYAFNAYYIIDRHICTSTIQMALIVAFTYCQWLRERATILRYTHIAFLVIFIIFILSLFIFNFVAASMVEVKTGDSLDL